MSGLSASFIAQRAHENPSLYGIKATLTVEHMLRDEEMAAGGDGGIPIMFNSLPKNTSALITDQFETARLTNRSNNGAISSSTGKYTYVNS